MKITPKKILSAFLIFCSSVSFSQFYFDAGLKAGTGLTVLLNNNIFNDGHVVSEFSFGPAYGGKLGLNFNEKYCVAFDIMYSGFRQKYTVKSDSLTWNKTIRMNTLDIAILFRNYVEGTYFEVGPQISMLKKATESNSVTGSANTITYFEPAFYAAVIGFGANIMGTDNVSLMIGFRATYALNDVISSAGGRSNVPAYPLNEPFYTPSYSSYKASSPLAIRFLAEINFDLGYFTKSTCNKKRAKFVTF